MKKLILKRKFRRLDVGDELVTTNNIAHSLIENGVAELKEIITEKNKMMTRDRILKNRIKTK